MAGVRARAFLGPILMGAVLTPLSSAAQEQEVSSAARAETSLRLITPLGDQVFEVQRLQGEEAISRLFSFELEATGPRAVSIDELIGKPITVVLETPGAGVRSLHGIVSRISRGAIVRRSATYALEMVPRLWLLSRTRQSRLFQGLSVPEIVDRVLAEGGVPNEARLEGDYPKRDCVAQYNESDFDFVSRLLEEEGIYYTFDHSGVGDRLVLADSPAGHSSLPGSGRVRFVGAAPRQKPGITEWTKLQELRPGKVTLTDYDFHHPDLDLEVSASIQESVVAGQVSHRLRLDENAELEIFDYPGDYAQRFDDETPSPAQVLAEGERTVAIRMQQEAVSSLVIHGTSQHSRLLAGYKFSLVGHPDANGEYVLTSVQHSARRTSPRGNGQGGLDYSNSFTCIPVGLPFRPPRTTPVPRIPGVQTAIVTGPAGEEIYTDELGRVKVQFHWDRSGQRDEKSSCWIRVASLHAGQETGFTPVPRIGQEVVVSFVGGDPDQPVIVGSVYNGADRPPAPR